MIAFLLLSIAVSASRCEVVNHQYQSHGTYLDGGYVLTCAHVFYSGNRLGHRVRCRFPNETRVGYLSEIDRFKDVALIKLDRPVRFLAGAKTAVLSGDEVVVFGKTCRVIARLRNPEWIVVDYRRGQLGDSGTGIFDPRGNVVGLVHGRMNGYLCGPVITR